jgi:hypothetical protein
VRVSFFAPLASLRSESRIVEANHRKSSGQTPRANYWRGFGVEEIIAANELLRFLSRKLDDMMTT